MGWGGGGGGLYSIWIYSLRDLISPYSIRVCSIVAPFYGDLLYKDLFYRDLFYKDLFYNGSHKPHFYRDSLNIGFILWGSIL